MRKQIYQISIFQLFLFLMFSCSNTTSLDRVLELAGDNRIELERVLMHYDSLNDYRKKAAAEFLIVNMENKFYYDGKILKHYMPIFETHDSLFKAGNLNRKDPIFQETLDELIKVHGTIQYSGLSRIYDYRVLSADFIIKNIEDAFMAWASSPFYNPNDFKDFCEYILPYKIANEVAEEYRERYYNKFKHIMDTISSYNGIIKGFSYELSKNLNIQRAGILRNYSIDIPVSLLEKSRGGGTCRHLAIYQASVMRACGLPITIDEAIWANRALVHTWNVMVSDTGKIVAFDALGETVMTPKYKPAKIFRRRYSREWNELRGMNLEDIPLISYFIDDKDVTHEYTQTRDISIPITYPYKGNKRKQNGLICTFDNKNWRIVFWGEIKSGMMHFKNMATDALYLGAYYDNGLIIPATLPFVLDTEGRITLFDVGKDKCINMTLYRKYPAFSNVEEWASDLVNAKIEGANNPEFYRPVELKQITEKSIGVADSLIINSSKFRYIRMFFDKECPVNLAEIEFYGKRNKEDEEKKLNGENIGSPYRSSLNAVDGNLETSFSKSNYKAGWVGLDLGDPYYITRVRFCPRSDTNFILEGDNYELKYWNEGKWNSVGIKKAEQYNYINFENIPSGTIYLLSDLSKGKEERIFTYVDGKQVWW
ncbi:discoidin domain-containing protein [Bacteroidales bacterium OttesenSCG-928-L03]|nr:discoidin domain-containing protein [Bacteroidales bacterium OttesenSCG-928-L03]